MQRPPGEGAEGHPQSGHYQGQMTGFIHQDAEDITALTSVPSKAQSGGPRPTGDRQLQLC